MTADLRARRDDLHADRHRERRSGLLVAVLTLAALAGIVGAGVLRARDDRASASSPMAVTVAWAGGAGAAGLAAPAGGDPAVAAPTPSVDLAEAIAEDCVITAERLGPGDTGTDVSCLQQGLVNAGYLEEAPTGTFGPSTFAAVERVQEERALFVDGIVGRETAISLGVWPDEQSFVVRTPPPPPGATDSWGHPLSSVSSTGADAPPLPADSGSGSGKRVVYERRTQRVWAVDDDENIVRSWLVSGSKYGNELPGWHEVYSRSERSTAWNGAAYLPLMIRWLETDIGHIGFHGIPTKVSDGSAYQTEDELGARLSGGCQRQANRDAAFLWDFAPVGTTVVVL